MLPIINDKELVPKGSQVCRHVTGKNSYGFKVDLGKGHVFLYRECLTTLNNLNLRVIYVKSFL